MGNMLTCSWALKDHVKYLISYINSDSLREMRSNFQFRQIYLITNYLIPLQALVFLLNISAYMWRCFCSTKYGLENTDIEDSKWLTKGQESLRIFVSFWVWGRNVSSPEKMKKLNGHVYPAQMTDLRCSGKQLCVANKYKVFLHSACSKNITHIMRLISSSK